MKTMLTRGLCALLSVTASLAFSASKPPAADPIIETPVEKTGDRKVLLIGVDGVQLEELQKVYTPNFDRLTIRKAYTGGITGTDTEQGTSSGPGWSTILTGVWANKHQITSNGSDLANPEFPSIFKRLRNAQPEAKIASVVNWSQPNTVYFRNEVGSNDVTLSGLSDSAVTSKGIELIQQGYDFIFLHIDDPDGAGHSSGFGNAYNESLITTDGYLGQLLNAINLSEHDWLVLLTTDHGRQPVTGYNHGNQTKEEKTIFIGSNKTLNKEFNSVAENLNNNDFSGLYGHPAQTSLVPTALRYLGVQIEKEWLLDGIPLIDEVGVRKLMPAQSGNADITWFSDEDNSIEVYRNNQFVTQVSSSNQAWSDNSNAKGIFDYVLVQNNTPASVRLNKSNIEAAVSWDAFRAYFFRDDQKYVRFAKVTDKADDGYPKVTSDDSWPGFGNNAPLLTAAFEKNTSTSYYFFSNGQYIRYNNTLDKADSGYPKPTDNSTWPGLGAYAQNITAALRWNNDKVYFFLNDGQYIRYDLSNDQVDAGYPQAINNDSWPGLGAYANDITAAVKWNNSTAYIFLTGQRYIRYSISDDQADAGYPVKINNSNWSGLMKP